MSPPTLSRASRRASKKLLATGSNLDLSKVSRPGAPSITDMDHPITEVSSQRGNSRLEDTKSLVDGGFLEVGGIAAFMGREYFSVLGLTGGGL